MSRVCLKIALSLHLCLCLLCRSTERASLLQAAMCMIHARGLVGPAFWCSTSSSPLFLLPQLPALLPAQARARCIVDGPWLLNPGLELGRCQHA